MVEDDYEKLLDRARSELPPEVLKRKRFELPRPTSFVSGNRTVLHNFKEVCDRLRRDQGHLLKFLSKELATAGTINGTRAVFQGKFDVRSMERLVDRYAREFVLCPVCHQPDTRIVREDRFYFLVCDACGARSSIRGI